jgi:hypothetical protein
MLHSHFSFSGNSKKILSFVLFTLYFVLTNTVFGACQPTKSCDTKSDPLGYTCYDKGKYSYLCNIENFCLGKAPGANPRDYLTADKQLIKEHTPEKYPDLSKEKKAPTFEDLRKIYEDTQNNVMNCATMKSKYELHKQINTYKIPEKSKKVLEKANQTIEQKMKEQKCMESREWDKIYNSKDLLDSMTYEQCGYNMYLYYYDQYAQRNIGILWDGKKITTVSGWNEALGNYSGKIAAEQELSQRTMDTALSLYENHERTYPSHILLGVTGDQIDEIKQYNKGVVELIKRLVKLIFNSQGKPEMPGGWQMQA